jgi:hypothetical protein
MSVAPIKINVAQPKDLFQIKAQAFIQILQHAHRFWEMNNPKSEYAYGILVGSIENRTRTVTEAIPVLHASEASVVFDDAFYKHWDDYNALKMEMEQTDLCIGWYKVIDRDMKFKAPDVRNQVKMQTLNPKNVALLLDPEKFITDQEYGFSVFKLMGDKIFHEMCDFAKIPWEIMEIGADVDKVVNMVLEMIRKYHTDQPYIEEIDEVKPPPPPPPEEGEDDGNYIDVKIDPNAPFFF